MEKSFKKWEIIGFFVCSGLAVAFHFLYEALPNALTAALCPVNESVWEHGKLLVFPFAIWTLIEYLSLKNKTETKTFISAKSKALVFLPAMLIVFHYTYRGVLGFDVMAIDVISTFVFLTEAFLISYFSVKNKKTPSAVFAVCAIIIILLFIVFTFITPRINLFMDPITGKYGV